MEERAMDTEKVEESVAVFFFGKYNTYYKELIQLKFGFQKYSGYYGRQPKHTNLI